MKTIFFNILKQQLVEYLAKKFTVENVQALLDTALKLARDKANETQTDWDDALIKAVEYLIKDTNAAGRIVSLALALIDGLPCEADPAVEEIPLGNEIAEELKDWAEKQW